MVRLILAIAFVVAAHAQTQAEMNAKACSGYKKADAELNSIYKRILSINAKDSDFANALRAAQAAWIAFRDAHLKSLYSDPSENAYGSVNPMCRCIVLEQLTAERTRQLREIWIRGTPEGDVCAGSSPIRKTPLSSQAIC